MKPYKTRTKNPEKILCAAADYIEEYGWAQETFGGNGEPACVVGAINTVAVYEDARLAAFRVLSERLISRTFQPGALLNWNDRPDRKKEEVVAALRGDGC